MLIGKGQTQHWMEAANWGNPKRSLELQLGDQPVYYMVRRAQLLSDFTEQFLGLFKNILIG